jgi:sugar/nucleoside kinase (ribokinase family)
VKPVLIIGELNVDLILSGCARLPTLGTEITADGFVVTLGSSSAICAVGLARLGRPVSFVGVVGADQWGDYCLDTLRHAGVDVSGVHRDDGLQTGVTVSLTSPAGRALVTYLGATASMTADRVQAGLFAGGSHLHVSSVFLQTGLRHRWPSILQAARHNGCSVSLDPGWDPDNAWDGDVRGLVPLVDVLLPNDVELEGFTGRGDPADALQALANGHTLTIAKLGADGCMALVEGRPLRVAPPPVTVVDTTGAGDSFNAGFLDAWLARRPLLACMRAGAACGALSTRAPGGTAAQPTRDELAHLLEDGW